MPDNIENSQEKNTSSFKKRRLIGLILMGVLVAAFLIIYQKYQMEAAKEADKTGKPAAGIESKSTNAGNDLESLVMRLQQERDRNRPTPVMVTTEFERVEAQPITYAPQQPVQIYVQAAKQKEFVIPDGEMVKLGGNIRQAKIQALQSPSYVGGFKEQPQVATQQQGGGNASQPYSGSSGNQSAGGGAGGNYLGSFPGMAVAPDPNKQKEKQDFLYSKGADLTPQGYSANIPIPQQFPLELKAGTVIPGIMISGLNSDLPGSVIGQVSEHVYDTATGQHILIPKGSRLVGAYDSDITYGQKRIGVVWNRIIAPDGTSLNISGSQGMDRAGYSGMPGKVDEHWGQLIGAALLASVFIGGAEMISPTDSNSGGLTGNNNSRSARDVIAESVAVSVLQVSSRLLDRAMNIKPTIKIRPGARFNVFVAQDIVFPYAW